MSLPKDIRRVIALPMTRAALGTLPGLKVEEDDGRFAETLARLNEADAPKSASVLDEMLKRR